MDRDHDELLSTHNGFVIGFSQFGPQRRKKLQTAFERLQAFDFV